MENLEMELKTETSHGEPGHIMENLERCDWLSGPSREFTSVTLPPVTVTTRFTSFTTV